MTINDNHAEPKKLHLVIESERKNLKNSENIDYIMFIKKLKF